MEDGLYYYTHTNVLFHIVMHTQLAEMGQGPPKLSLIFRHLLHNSVTALRFPVLHRL